MSYALDARPWPPGRPPRRILAMRLHALGDTVLTLPYLAALRDTLPDVKIDLLTREEVAGIPRAVDLFDDVVALGGGRRRRGIWASALAHLPGRMARGYDVVLDLQNDRLTRLVRRALRPRAWSGFDRFGPALAGERTRTTIEAAGFPLPVVRAGLTLRDPEAGPRVLRDAGWDGTGEVVVLNPAGGPPGRRWPAGSWLALARRLAEDRAPAPWFVALGTPSTRVAAVAREWSEGLDGRVLDLVGRTTAAEAFAVVARADLVLSEDSGLLHMAWVAGVPTYGLFGASRGTWARPHGTRSGYLRACERPDGICMDGVCRGSGEPCIARLDPAQVYAALTAWRATLPRPPSTLFDGRGPCAPPLDG